MVKAVAFALIGNDIAAGCTIQNLGVIFEAHGVFSALIHIVEFVAIERHRVDARLVGRISRPVALRGAPDHGGAGGPLIRNVRPVFRGNPQASQFIPTARPAA